MNKILFPTDFSEAAHKAFEYAIEIAKKANSKLDVIHTYPEPHKGKELYMDSAELRKARKERQNEMQVKIDAFTKPYDSKYIGSKIIFPSDDSTDEVVARSKRNYDLIIMGTKGERNALDKIVGSFTTNTMMNAHCPVLAIPSDSTFKNINTITYSTSLNEDDKNFTKSLSEFTNIFQATIEHLHVMEDSEEKVHDHLKAKGLSPDDSNIHLVKNDSVMDGVEDYLNNSKTDILALFIPKRSFIDKLFHRSVTKELTFHAALPLFVYREK
ncbi:conserved hypothetical protein [Tenacibaculum xiamenense]